MGTSMRTPELEARHRASAIVAQMFLSCLRAMMGDFEKVNISSVLPELLIAMVVRLNDDGNKPAISLSEISRIVGIPRQTVRRHVEQLVKRGVVIRTDGGVVGSDTYLFERIDAPYFKDIVAAIRAAALALEQFK